MKGIVGSIPEEIDMDVVHKYIVAQSENAWTYYAVRSYWSKRLEDYGPNHMRIAEWNNIPSAPVKISNTLENGVVEQIIFPCNPVQFEGVIGSGHARLQTIKNSLILVLCAPSKSYGQINNKVFEALREPLLDAYRLCQPSLVDVVLSKRDFSRKK